MEQPREQVPPGARVLVLRLSAMGDVVQAIGAVRALVEARPDLRVAWVVQRPFAPLLSGLSGVEVIVHDRGGRARGYLSTGRVLRALRPLVALDLQGNWKSAGLARLSGATVRIGAGGASRRERASGVLLNHLVALPPEAAHPARQAIALVRAVAPEARDIDPWLGATPDEVERERAALRGLGVDPDRPFRVLVLGDPRDPRSIRPSALAREAAQGPIPCVAVAGPEEIDVAPPPGCSHLVHARGELRRLVALGAIAARAGAEVVGPDKGATHVLAGAGARTVCMFGPTGPERTGPPAARPRVSPRPPDCAPCWSRTCRRADGPVCMDFTSEDGRVPAP